MCLYLKMGNVKNIFIASFFSSLFKGPVLVCGRDPRSCLILSFSRACRRIPSLSWWTDVHVPLIVVGYVNTILELLGLFVYLIIFKFFNSVKLIE